MLGEDTIAMNMICVYRAYTDSVNMPSRQSGPTLKTGYLHTCRRQQMKHIGLIIWNYCPGMEYAEPANNYSDVDAFNL